MYEQIVMIGTGTEAAAEGYSASSPVCIGLALRVDRALRETWNHVLCVKPQLRNRRPDTCDRVQWYKCWVCKVAGCAVRARERTRVVPGNEQGFKGQLLCSVLISSS